MRWYRLAGVRRRWLVGPAACLAFFVFAGVAWAPNYFTGTLSNGSEVHSGWNYWYANYGDKDVGTENVGFQNSNGTRKTAPQYGTPFSVTRDQLGIGGYMYALVKNVAGYGVWNSANACTC